MPAPTTSVPELPVVEPWVTGNPMYYGTGPVTTAADTARAKLDTASEVWSTYLRDSNPLLASIGKGDVHSVRHLVGCLKDYMLSPHACPKVRHESDELFAVVPAGTARQMLRSLLNEHCWNAQLAQYLTAQAKTVIEAQQNVVNQMELQVLEYERQIDRLRDMERRGRG